MKKLHFSPLWRCNQDCLFCLKGEAPPGATVKFPLAEAVGILKEKRKEGFVALSLDGGEPTLYKELPELAAAALDAGYKEVNVLTNGVALADEGKVKELLAAHPAAKKRLSFCVSLHSHEPAVSAALTNSADDLWKTLRAVRNLTAAGFSVSLYHIMTRLNCAALPDFARFVVRELRGVSTVTFSYIYPTHHKMGNMGIYPKLSEVPRRFAKAAGILEAAGIRTALSSCGIVPWCLLKDAAGLFISASVKDNRGVLAYDGSREEPMPFLREIFKKEGKVKSVKCARCLLDKICGGVWEFYGRKYGTAELTPYRRGSFSRVGAGKRKAALACRPGAADETCLQILDARLKGCSVIGLRGTAALSDKELTGIKDFSRKIGIKKAVLSR